MFENISFIGSNKQCSSLQLRCKFHITKKSKATLFVCGLGFGYYWINGQKVSEDLFTAPVSDYSKTLWVNKYDITEMISEGDNVFCAWLGNGFYNEGIESVWNHHKAHWRGEKQLILKIEIDGKTVLFTNEQWKCNGDNAIIFNELRSGEYFDYNKFNPNWLNFDFDDSKWDNAVKLFNCSNAEFLLCECPPIREREEYSPIAVYENQNSVIYDFGHRLSGYVRIKCYGEKGTTVFIKHSEDYACGKLENHGQGCYYPSVPFQEDRIILNGEEVIYSPIFTYHGFRYVEIAGIKKEQCEIKAVFVSHKIKRTAYFHCSDESLNKLYDAAINSSLCNMFYSLTDCPTREKLGWCNDAVASLEQMCLNFDMQAILTKWMRDIVDTQKENGDISGIAPSPDWGYGIGAVTGIIIFELPFRVYESYGDASLLKKYEQNILRYYDFYFKNTQQENYYFELADWDGCHNCSTDIKYVELCYLLIMQIRLKQLSDILNDLTLKERAERDYVATKSRLEKYFIDGKCKVETVTAVCMAGCLRLGDIDKLKEQLQILMQECNNKPDIGMVGMQFFFKFVERENLIKIGRSMLTEKEGVFMKMIEKGDTLWETCNVNAHTVSLNHHMYSCFATFLIKKLNDIQ